MTATTATTATTSPFGTDAIRKPAAFCAGTGQAPSVLVPGRTKADGSPCATCGAVLLATKAGKMPRHQAAPVMDAADSPLLGDDITPEPSVEAPKAKRVRKPKAVAANEGAPATDAEVAVAVAEAEQAPVEAPKVPAYRAPVKREGSGLEAKFHKVRANGTTRAIPTYAAGTVQRDTADAMFAAREAGQSVAVIAEAFHVSVASVRRMLQSLALTVQQERLAASAVKAAATKAAKASK